MQTYMYFINTLSAFIAAYSIFEDEILASNKHCSGIKINSCLIRPTILIKQKRSTEGCSKFKSPETRQDYAFVK